MGCQSVTGRGQGSAEATAKGCKERNFVGVEKLIGPRVVLAAQVTLAAGAGSLSLPVALDKDHYCFLASAPNAVTVTKVLSGSNVVSLTLAGTGTDIVDVVAVKIGV